MIALQVGATFNKVSMERVQNYRHIVGYCLFDCMSYLFNANLSTLEIWKDYVSYLFQALTLDTKRVV